MDDREKFRRKMKLKGEIAIQKVQESIKKALESTDKKGKPKEGQENIK